MSDPTRSFSSGWLREFAPGAWYIPAVMSNVYALAGSDGRWVLVDTGAPGSEWWVRGGLRQIFGRNARPEAILLTHGHFDHINAIGELAGEWEVPVWAHPLELPYLTGRSDYPPPDPTVGGAMAQLSRLFPRQGVNLGEGVRALPDPLPPPLENWRVVHSPGHSAGHISLFRDSDRVLIAGDAVITVNQENPLLLMSQARELHLPPLYFTTDWDAALASIGKLSALRPLALAAGHGLPISGEFLPDAFAQFAAGAKPPRHGRYVHEPARTDERGVLSVPPPVSDPAPRAALIGLAAVAGTVFVGLSMRRRAR